MQSKEQSGRTRSAPHYAFADKHDRELFLSSLGLFTDQERALFHRVCAIWEPEIAYRKAYSTVEQVSEADSRDLGRLLSKLRRRQCAVVTTRTVEGGGRPYGVMLCEPGEPIFFITVLEEYLRRVERDHRVGLPTDRELGSETPPVAIRRRLDTGVITKALLASMQSAGSDAPAGSEAGDTTGPGESEDLFVYTMPLRRSEDSVLLPGSILAEITTLAEQVLQAAFNDGELLTEFAKLRKLGALQLKQRIAEADLGTWRELSAELAGHMRELAAGPARSHIATLEPAAAVMRIAAEAALEAAAISKRRAERREAAISELVQRVRESSEAFLTQSWLNRQFNHLQEQHPEEFEAIKTGFYRQTKPSVTDRVPAILRIQGRYIHRDRIYPEFEGRLENARRELHNYYLRTLSAEIRFPNRARNPALFGAENLERDIAERLRRFDPFVSALLGDAALLTEVVIHADQIAPGDDDGPLTRGRDRLFLRGSMRLKPYREIMGISLRALLEEHIDGLGIIRQIWLRLTGRQARLWERYVGPATTKVVANRVRVPDRKNSEAQHAQLLGSESGGAWSSTKSTRTNSPRPGRASRSAAESKSAAGTEGNEPFAPRRPYSHKEREDAWQAFQRTLNDE